jgi:hypothetical protein
VPSSFCLNMLFIGFRVKLLFTSYLSESISFPMSIGLALVNDLLSFLSINGSVTFSSLEVMPWSFVPAVDYSFSFLSNLLYRSFERDGNYCSTTGLASSNY